MAESSLDFVIEERAQGTDQSERFRWTAASSPTDPQLGGAKAMPKKPWHLGGKLRTSRTDYPGARYPTEQVLGPAHEPFTLVGRWDDRWNFAGYATEERRRFEGMCRRGNPIRIMVGLEVWEGLIVEWSFDWRRAWDIGYSFTFSVHGQPGEDVPFVTGNALQSAKVTFDRVLIGGQRLAAIKPPRSVLGDINQLLGDITAGIDKLSDKIDSRTGTRGLRPINTFLRIATQLRMIQGSANNIIAKLIAVRSDTELTVRTAKDVLDFEVQSRSMRQYALLVAGECRSGARQMEQRGKPPAARLYRPFAGESLYHVSRICYGTPYSWRLIADRNNLRALKFDGTELLIIPTRGEG